MSGFVTIARALEEAPYATETCSVPQGSCNNVLPIVAFGADMQRIDAELNSRSAQPNCCRQTVRSIDDEIGICKDGVEVFNFVVPAGEHLNAGAWINAPDTLRRDMRF
jgi:hypothetical protein